MNSLKKQLVQSVKIIVLGLLIGVGVNYAFAVNWTPPTQEPTGGNTGAPVNVTGTAQTKLGGLIVASSAGIVAPTPGFIVRNGYVGIGTDAPAQKLEVSNGNVAASGYCLPGSLPLGGCITAWPQGGGTGSVGPGNSGYVARFNAAGNNVVNSSIFDNGTNVGIKNINPTKTLDIEGGLRVRGGNPQVDDVLAATNGTTGETAWKNLVIKNCEWRVLSGPDPVTITCDNDGNQIMTGIKTIDSDAEGYRGVQSIRCCELGLSQN